LPRSHREHTLTNTLQLQQANTRWLSTVALLCHQALDESPLHPPHCAEQTSRLAEAVVVGSLAGCHAVRRASVFTGLMVAAPCSDLLGGEHPPNPAAGTFAAVDTGTLRAGLYGTHTGRRTTVPDGVPG